jgi:hypothetical protein
MGRYLGEEDLASKGRPRLCYVNVFWAEKVLQQGSAQQREASCSLGKAAARVFEGRGLFGGSAKQGEEAEGLGEGSAYLGRQPLALGRLGQLRQGIASLCGSRWRLCQPGKRLPQVCGSKQQI